MNGTRGPARLRNEFELLICCARTSLKPEHVERIGELVRLGIDWGFLLEWTDSKRGRVTPLLYRSLSKACPGEVPAEVMKRLEKSSQDIRENNRAYAQELISILEQFEERGIPALFFKGPTLAVSVYGDLDLRFFRDLDVLVPPERIDEARKLMLGRGYSMLGVKRRILDEISPAQVAALCRAGFDFTFGDGPEPIAIDLHPMLIPRSGAFAIDYAELFSSPAYVQILGRPVPTLPKDELILYLCVHGGRTGHLWNRTAWVVDLAEILEDAGAWHWDRILAKARRAGVEHMLLVGLCLAADLFGAALPPPVQQRVEQAPRVTEIATTLAEWIFSDDFEAIPRSRRHALYMRSRERLRDRARYSFWCAVTDRLMLETVSFPGRLGFAYGLFGPCWKAHKWWKGRNVRRWLGAEQSADGMDG